MIKPEQIPPEVVWKLHDKLWEVGNPSVAEARTALAATLNAWPGMTHMEPDLANGIIILPLPQQDSDE